MIKSIFVSAAEPRLRAGWRLLLQTLIMLLFAGVVGILVGLAYHIQRIPLDSVLNEMVMSMVIYTGSVFVARRWLDRRSIVSLGLKLNGQALFDLFIGILIALPVMSLVFAIAWAAHWLTFEGFAWQVDPVRLVLKETLLILLAFVLGGWSEELLIRGYYLQTLESGLNTFGAVFLSSAVFGILHLGNAGATWSSVLGLSLFGALLAYGYLRTRQLWLPIGLHIGWNLFQGVIFGFPVSGIDAYRLTRITITGPELWTGGSFGPEAGLVILPGLVLGAMLIWIHTRQESPKRSDHDYTNHNSIPAIMNIEQNQVSTEDTLSEMASR